MPGILLLFMLPTPAFAKQKPDIVTFLADVLGWGDLVSYGHLRKNTRSEFTKIEHPIHPLE